MTGGPGAAAAATTLVVGEKVLATLIAQSAVHTPGVLRLQPRPLRAARTALTGVVRAGDAVEVERAAGSVRATIAIVATDARPVVETVRNLHRRITDELATAVATDAVVTVVVVDVVREDATDR